MNQLIPINSKDISLPSNYGDMINTINKALPAIDRNSKVFYKSKSQYSVATIDNTSLTPIRALYQILANITRTRSALEEAFIETRKTQLHIQKMRLEHFDDPIDAELHELEITKMELGLKSSTNSIQGALRKLSFLVSQHDNILKELGKTEITEEDYELEEGKAHVMIAFKQALCAARSRGGVIDEGNHIYFFDIGIPGAMAQAEITNYLLMEQELLKEGKAPTHNMTYEWLKALGERFAEYGKSFAQTRMLNAHDQKSLVQFD